MVKTIPIEKSAGEWLAEDIYYKGKIIIKKSSPEITHADIKKLSQHKIQKVKIKLGIPFAPAFLLAILLSLTFGNILFFLLT